jgi:hypothetical protein
VRGTDDEDNYATAARKITRKERDTDDQGKNVARREIPHTSTVDKTLTHWQILVAAKDLICT